VTTALGDVDVAVLEQAQPVRSFSSYAGQRHYTGLYWCATTGTHLAYESLMERDRMLLADFDPSVTAVVAQPFRVSGADGAGRRNRIPDLLLVETDRTVRVVDVKPASAAAKPDVAASFAWIGAVCASVGWMYEVWTGADSTHLANVRWLARCRRPGMVSDELLKVALDSVQRDTSIRSAVIVVNNASGSGVGAARLAVETLLWRGLLTTDLSSPLSPDHVIEPAGRTP
jgi:hypothetical protein